MNRKHNRRWLLAGVLAVSTTTLFTATAQAQQVEGHFTLPFAVRWGIATLPAGNYTFAARSTGEPFILTVRGSGTNAMIMAQGHNTLTGNRSSLHITWVGNQAVVSALQLAPCGATFSYRSHYRTLTPEEASIHPPGEAGASGANAAAQTTLAEIPVKLRKQ
jgi:hypothetical protein